MTETTKPLVRDLLPDTVPTDSFRDAVQKAVDDCHFGFPAIVRCRIVKHHGKFCHWTILEISGHPDIEGAAICDSLLDIDEPSWSDSVEDLVGFTVVNILDSLTTGIDQLKLPRNEIGVGGRQGVSLGS